MCWSNGSFEIGTNVDNLFHWGCTTRRLRQKLHIYMWQVFVNKTAEGKKTNKGNTKVTFPQI